MRAAALLVLDAAMLAGCGSRSGHRRTVVTATGHIGPLRVGESDRGDVISFAGKPDSERHGRYDDYPPFDALRYGCRGKFATDPAGLPRCRTVFYLDAKRGRLALLYTEDPQYVDPHGVHAGMATRVAQRRLKRRPFNGCFSGFGFDTKKGFLVMWLVGGKKPVGNHVGFLVGHSRHLNPGVLDCIDS